MKMNEKLLVKVGNSVFREPTDTWDQYRHDSIFVNDKALYGTAPAPSNICGWILFHGHEHRHEYGKVALGPVDRAHRVAKEIAGLTDQQADALFNTDVPEANGNLASAVVYHLLETGVVDWTITPPPTDLELFNAQCARMGIRFRKYSRSIGKFIRSLKINRRKK